VHQAVRPHDVTAKVVADALVAEADAEERDAGRADRADDAEAVTGFLGAAWAGLNHDHLRVHGHDLFPVQLVVAVHLGLPPELAEVLHDVEGKGVEIVDNEQHGLPVSSACIRHWSSLARDCRPVERLVNA